MHSNRGYLAYLGKLLHFVQLVFVQPAFNICPICQVAPGQVGNLRGTITIETGPVTQHNGFKSIPAQCCPRPIVLECRTMFLQCWCAPCFTMLPIVPSSTIIHPPTFIGVGGALWKGALHSQIFSPTKVVRFSKPMSHTLVSSLLHKWTV